MNLERDNLSAGLFVLMGLVLGVVLVFALADVDRLFRKTQTIDVVYSLSDGLRGLKAGAEVSLGDEPIGSVSAIDDVIEEGRVVAKRVSFAIPDHYRLRRDAVIELVVPPLGAGTRLNIRSVGVGETYEHGVDEPLAGAMAGSLLTESLMRDAGIGDEQRRQIQRIITNVADMTDALRADIPELTGAARRMLTEAEPLAADARQAAAHLKDATARINALLADKDPTIRETLDNVHALSQRLMPVIDEAKTAVDNIRVATDEVKSLILTRRPHLEKMLADLQLTGEQLKLAAIEIRRSPWRLLYKPSQKELASDNLYDAARSFAMAASTLDATVAALATVQQRDPADEPRIRELLDYLEAITQRFTEAQDQFWTALDQASR
jgi:ABC-type transporter Mla subunit MlaD